MNRKIKIILKIIGALALLVGLVLAGSFYAIFGTDQKARSGPALPHGIVQIADNITTIFLLDVGQGKIVLIDAGADPSGKPILGALKARGKTADDVVAIFITHAHPDHDAAVKVFPQAEIFAMDDEVGIASGKAPYNGPLHKWIGNYNPYPFRVTHPLHDTETVTIGDTPFTAYQVPGHTPGSTTYLAQGVLFTGDAFSISSDLQIEGPVKIFTTDYPQALLSLQSLAGKVAPRASEIQFIATSHNGNLSGADGLRKIAAFRPK